MDTNATLLRDHKSIITDVVIIGTGPIGIFAIFQAGMLNMKCHVIEALDHVGGQCAALYPEKPIYDIPGHPSLSAQTLIDQLYAQAAPFRPVFHLGQRALRLEINNNNTHTVYTAETAITAKIVIIAAGNGAFGPNKPSLDNIEIFENKSVLYSISNKTQFIDKSVVIAGGGDSSLDWTVVLADIAKKIYLVHRREKFRGLDTTLFKIHDLAQQGKIELVTPYQLKTLIGINGELNAIEVVNLLDEQTRKIDCDYLLAFFGLKMELGPLKTWGFNITTGGITVDPIYYETNIKGIYAVGDIARYDGKLKLILTGFAEVASALHHAYHRVFDGKALHFQYSTSNGVPNDTQKS